MSLRLQIGPRKYLLLITPKIQTQVYFKPNDN